MAPQQTEGNLGHCPSPQASHPITQTQGSRIGCWAEGHQADTSLVQNTPWSWSSEEERTRRGKRGPGEVGTAPPCPVVSPNLLGPPHHTHQGRAVVAVEDVDEVSDGEHPCGDTGAGSAAHTPRCQAGEGARPCCQHSPTKLCVLLSQSGAARTPLATSATKAFLICQESDEGVRAPLTPVCPSLSIPLFVTSREMSKTTSLQLVGMAS